MSKFGIFDFGVYYYFLKHGFGTGDGNGCGDNLGGYTQGDGCGSGEITSCHSFFLIRIFKSYE